MGEAGGEGASQQPTDLERTGSVEQLTQEKRKTYSAMMDEMERQVGNYGQFFVKSGAGPGEANILRPETESKGDTRALLLITSVPYPNDETKELFVVITADGPKGIVAERGGKVEKELRLTIEDKLNPQLNLKDELPYRLSIPASFEGYNSGFNTTLMKGGGGNFIEFNGPLPMHISAEDLIPVGLETVQKVMRESQAKARIPEELDVKKANERLQQAGTLLQEAKSLSQFVKQLPPKQ